MKVCTYLSVKIRHTSQNVDITHTYLESARVVKTCQVGEAGNRQCAGSFYFSIIATIEILIKTDQVSNKMSRQHYPGEPGRVSSFLQFREIICQRVSIPTKVIEFLSTIWETLECREKKLWTDHPDGDQSEPRVWGPVTNQRPDNADNEMVISGSRWSLLITHRGVLRQIEIDHSLTFLLPLTPAPRLWETAGGDGDMMDESLYRAED